MSQPAPSPLKLNSRNGGLLSNQIANHYRQEIFRGAFPSGSHLPTCQEVAKEAGVAAQTVNRAFDLLAEEGLVSRRRSVGTIVHWGGEAPRQLTRTPRSPRHTSLPICQVARISTLKTDESDLFVDYLNGFTEGFDAWKCRFEIAHLRDTQSDLEMVKALIEQRQARGLVCMPLASDAMEYLVASRFPLVFINHDESARGVTSVIADPVRGYHEAWAFVDQLGHRHAAFFGLDVPNFGPRSQQCASGRELAQPLCTLQTAVKAPAGATPEQIWDALVQTYGPWKRGARPRRWPTLFFVQTDVIATKLIRALREHGVRVPTDLSVIGFNDASIAKHWDPPLTTLAKPRFQMALAAARLLLDLLAGRPAAVAALQTFPIRLLERESASTPPPL